MNKKPPKVLDEMVKTVLSYRVGFQVEPANLGAGLPLCMNQ